MRGALVSQASAPQAGRPRGAGPAQVGESRADDRATEPSDLVALVDLFREAEDSRFSGSAIRAAGLDAGATHAVARASTQLARACKGGAKQRFAGTAAEADS